MRCSRASGECDVCGERTSGSVNALRSGKNASGFSDETVSLRIESVRRMIEHMRVCYTDISSKSLSGADQDVRMDTRIGGAEAKHRVANASQPAARPRYLMFNTQRALLVSSSPGA